MKKITLILLNLLFINRVSAIENIKVNDENLSPYFDNEIKIYNYFTNKENIKISVTESKDEEVSGYGFFTLTENMTDFIISSNKYGEYTIRVFKNYDNNNYKNLSGISNLYIEGYEIDFDKNKYEYSITLNDEEMLDIEYELINPESYVSITGNGNFNENDNLITINIDNKEEYKIHAYKTINASKIIENIEEIKTMSKTKKEIVKILIITISCTIIFGFYYLVFIKKLF